VNWRSLLLALMMAAAACTNLRSGSGRPPSPDASQPPAADSEPAAGVVQTAPDGAPVGEPARTEQPQRGPVSPLSVLLIVVDGMRTDMPWAGYPRDIAPNLTALYQRSVRYTRAYSVSSYTAKSVAAVLAGRYPSSLLRSGHFFTVFSKSNLFFPEILQAGGVHTMSAQAGTYIRHGTGLDQGFAAWGVIKGVTQNPRSPQYITSKALTERTIELLQEAPADKLRFLYVHYMDPHEPYLKHPQAPDWGWGPRDRYDSEIWLTDHWVGKLLDFCKQQPWWKKTAVIITSDHGECFGEHGRRKHGFGLWEVLVRVPLFFQLPGVAPRDLEVRRSHIDLASTVLELMGQPVPSEIVGQSLVAEMYGEKPAARPINPEVRALVHGDWKLLVNGNDFSYSLYELASDPGENKDLARSEPEKLKEMKALYREVWGAVPDIKPFGGFKLVNGEFANGPAE
jgi:choline-sulfatase